MNINTHLKNRRESMGLTQVQVAEKANITERSYQRIEKGVQDPRTTVSMLIAKALNTTVEKIFPLQQQPDGNPDETNSQQNDITKNSEPQ